MDECRDDERIHGKLQINQPAVVLSEPQRRQVEDVQPVGEPNQEEERVNGKRARAAQLNENRPAQQKSAGDDPDRDERKETRAQVHPVILLIRSKIGRYIAMTMPPTMPPRNAIMIGSSSVNRPATATSTSSS